jgi:hypothetical protein
MIKNLLLITLATLSPLTPNYVRLETSDEETWQLRHLFLPNKVESMQGTTDYILSIEIDQRNAIKFSEYDNILWGGFEYLDYSYNAYFNWYFVDTGDYLDLYNYDPSASGTLSYAMHRDSGLTNIEKSSLSIYNNLFKIVNSYGYGHLVFEFKTSGMPENYSLYNSLYLTANTSTQTAYANGYNQGYDAGYNQGQVDDFDGFSVVLGAIFDSITVFGSIQLIPGLSLGMIVGVVVIFGLVFFILGKRGGGD